MVCIVFIIFSLPLADGLVDLEFTNIWETKFNVIDPADFDCTVNRTKGDTNTQMSLINHFLDKLVLGQPAPDVSKANVTNSASGPGSLGAHVDACVALNTRPPNFLLVDVSLPGAQCKMLALINSPVL